MGLTLTHVELYGLRLASCLMVPKTLNKIKKIGNNASTKSTKIDHVICMECVENVIYFLPFICDSVTRMSFYRLYHEVVGSKRTNFSRFRLPPG